ncbi:MAG TPA: site-2 protease family protein [Oscillatoriales cyanobacterium M59_W2019_021]|nr:site-2 protease family protein [Oscillatoriales cyanobacterium M59_W2019_021]
MNFFWLLLVLGLFTYLILQRSVPRITRTPIWLLWLVMMTPAAVLGFWAIVHGEDQPIPAIVAIAPFVLCFALYWWLVYRGRKPRESPTPDTTVPPPSNDAVIDAEEEFNPPASRLRPFDREEETKLKDCFPWSVYYIHNLEYRPQAVICRGQLRTDPDNAYKTVRDNIERGFGDRFLVVFHENWNAQQPFFVLVPNPQAQTIDRSESLPGDTPKGSRSRERTESDPILQPNFAALLLLITLFTTTGSGAIFSGVSPTDLQDDPALLLRGLPYSLSLIAILGTHELGHYLAAQWYKIRATLPFFIPFPVFLGTFGAFIQMRSPVPHRKALFDVSLAGPVAGLAIALPLLVWGFAHSEIVPLTENSGLLSFDSLTPSFSLLLTLIGKLTFGSALTAQKVIDLHPVAIAGYLGLIVTAFNLMPIGQLDGGHMVHAMFGQRTALGIAQVVRLLMLLLAFIHRDLWVWALLFFFMPIRDEPALNDVSELDNTRDFLGLLALTFLAIILLPAPNLLM